MYSGNNSTNNIVISSNKANSDTNSPSLFEVSTKLEKMPLKLVMNPKGQVRDYNSLKELINVETGLLSPDNCAELITALQLHQGRGAELFAKRRKKADNWIVDETNAGTQSLPSGIPDYQQYQPRPKAISPNILPAYSDAGKHRVQLNLHQNQLIEKYSKGGVQVVKSPWEAALQTGSASSAFLEESQGQCPTVSPPSMYHRQSTPRDLTDAAVKPSFALGMTNNQQQREEPYTNKSTAPTCSNPQRVLAYTPNVAQGWGGRSVELPKGLYIPKEISLSSYAPPQQKQPTFAPSQNFESTFQPIIKSNLGPSVDIQSSNGRFPLSISNPSGYSTFSLQPNYQKVPVNNIAPQVNFNPSPLSFDKLSRYENKSVNQNQQQYQNIRQKTQVHNASPIPFGTSSLPRSPICSMSSMGTSPQPQRLSSVPYHRSSNQDQSFNKLPRGWGDVQNNKHQQAYITPPTLSRNVPYTEVPYSDF